MRLRAHRDLSSDPAFPFQVGRLVGAAEAASLLLQSPQHQGDLALIGRHLGEVTAWFLSEKPSPPAITSRASEDTMIDPTEADTVHR